MKRLQLFLLVWTCIPLLAIAQGNTDLTDTLSWISASPKLNATVVRLKEINSGKPSMPGFRIQIYFGSLRSKANELRAKFAARFPELNPVVSYHQPNFKVRAGDFRTRMEAQSKLEIIEKEFPGAFVVPDEIRLPPLK